LLRVVAEEVMAEQEGAEEAAAVVEAEASSKAPSPARIS
jgi:hypothetical protein